MRRGIGIVAGGVLSVCLVWSSTSCGGGDRYNLAEITIEPAPNVGETVSVFSKRVTQRSSIISLEDGRSRRQADSLTEVREFSDTVLIMDGEGGVNRLAREYSQAYDIAATDSLSARDYLGERLIFTRVAEGWSVHVERVERDPSAPRQLTVASQRELIADVARRYDGGPRAFAAMSVVPNEPVAVGERFHVPSEDVIDRLANSGFSFVPDGTGVSQEMWIEKVEGDVLTMAFAGSIMGEYVLSPGVRLDAEMRLDGKNSGSLSTGKQLMVSNHFQVVFTGEPQIGQATVDIQGTISSAYEEHRRYPSTPRVLHSRD